MIGGQAPMEEAPSLGTEHELQRRVLLTTPADTVRGLSFHAVLDALRADLGEEAVERCLAPRVEKIYRSFFSYPVSEYLHVLYTTGWMLSEKHGGFENAVRRIGAGLAPGFLSSVVGRAYLLLAKDGPKQLISNMPVAFKATASFGECSITWTGPKSGVFRSRKDFLLYLNHEGGLLGLFRALGLQGAKVRGRQTGPLETEVEFSWE
jgi:uncharacterized protein (TIGR02265 family)